MNPTALPSATPQHQAQAQAQSLPLKELHLPEAIHWWPLAPGWWLLIVLVIGLSVLIGWLLYRRYQSNRDKRAAKRALQQSYQAWQQHQNNQLFLQQANQILKRLCRSRLPQGLSLSGDAWVDFLNQSATSTPFTGNNAKALSQGLYCPAEQLAELQPDAFLAACNNWLKHLNRHKETV